MKKLITTAISAAAACMLAVSLSATAFADCESAQQASENINVGWNLGNTLDSKGDWINGGVSNYETAWGNPVINKELIAGVKAAGFNTIRLPVTWDAHVDANGNIDEAWLDRVQEVVDWILDEGLYCVLNVHHDGGSDGWLVASDDCIKGDAKRFKGLWTNIAERFKDYDERLIFESFNEVLDESDSWTTSRTAEGYAAVNELNQMFVDAVRKTGGNNTTRNLMLQTYSAGSAAATFNNFELPDDTVDGHLLVQVHSYDPQGFTWTDATWTTMTDQWGDSSQIKVVEDLFSLLDRYSDKIGVPIIVGEFGAQSKNNDKERAEYAKCFISEGAKYGIKCFWWDNGGDFKIIDRTTGKATAPTVVKALVNNAEGSYDPDVPSDSGDVLKGDADGNNVVNASDAAAILKFAVGLADINEKAADFDGNGEVNASDASAILRAAVGL